MQLPPGSPADLTHSLTVLLEQAQLPEAPLLAAWTVSEYTGIPRLELPRHCKEPVTDTTRQQIEQTAERLSAHEPLQYILGYTDFMDLRIHVTPDVLIPRPETEQLISLILQQHPDFKTQPVQIADIGTGSGCIALALAHTLPQARVTAVDISSSALTVARSNAVRLGLDERISFCEGSLLEPLEEKSYQLIVANLPYIPSGKIAGLELHVQREPARALDGGEDGLDLLRKFIAQAPNKLCNGGYVYLETGHHQTAAAKRLMLQNGFRETTIFQDYEKKERYIQAAQ